MSIASELQRAHLAQLTPYASARRSMSGGAVWLNANEAPATPSRGAVEAQYNRYPSFQSAALNGAYAEYAQVLPEQVLSCRGSDEAIDLLIRSFCEPHQDKVMICTPTYGMYAISAQTQGAEVIDVPLVDSTDSGLQLNVDAMLAELHQVKLIFVCNPSNPLGNNLQLDALQQLLEGVGSQALVVIDEAYIEFAASTGVQTLNTVAAWLARFPQLVVLRTLSKAFGLAGIRCGFALANSDIIEVLRKVIAPYPMPQPCIELAEQALTQASVAAMWQQVEQTQQLREQLIAAIKCRPWLQKIWPSCTNFVLINVDNAAQLVSHCAAAGVLIRDQSAQRGLDNCVRISIGSNVELAQLLEVLP